MPAGNTTGSYLTLIRDLLGNGFRISRWYIPGHDGIDLPAAEGTPIRAIASGTVAYARDARLDPNAGKAWAIGGGNVVNINVGNNLTSQYAHLARIDVKPGQYVKRGDIIGTVGATGGLPNSPGATFGAASSHLHFGLWDRRTNKMIDPTKWLMAQRAGWSGPIDSQSLGAWGDQFSLPVGHVVTVEDVDAMMRTLRDNGWFKVDGGDGIMSAVGESVVRATLLRVAVGRQWNKDLQDDLQVAFAQDAANATALGGARPLIDAATGALGALTDPGNWVRILALGAGTIMVGIGAYGVLRASGAPALPDYA
jgi:hypothetical protein